MNARSRRAGSSCRWRRSFSRAAWVLGAFPRYILVTNEYDPGRLTNADGLAARGRRINCVYHINLNLLRKVLEESDTIHEVRPLIDSGRLRSLEDLLGDFRTEWGAS